jgi:Dolichyl-phosphate-mannose-protein mannosyltransferase
MKDNDLFRRLTEPLPILLFLLAVFIVISANGRMGNDEGIWSYIGRIWAQEGVPPYAGAVENKTPGIFGLYAISWILFGVNVHFVRALGIIAVLLTAWTVYQIGKALAGHLAGVFGMLIFGLTMSWHVLDGHYPAQTETFMVLFSTLSFYGVIKGAASRHWKRWGLAAGFSMGLAIAFKQIAVTTALALGVFFLLSARPVLTPRKRLGGIALIGLGIGLATLLSLVPLWLSGVTFDEYVRGAWLLLLNQGSSASVQDHISGFGNVWGNSRMVLFYPGLALLLFRKRPFRQASFAGLGVWLFFDFLGANSSGIYWGHQLKQIVPSLSVLTGVLLGDLFARPGQEKGVAVRHASTAVFAIVLMMFPYRSLARNVYLNTLRVPDVHKEIGRWLKDHTTGRDLVYIAGSEGNPILSYSERVSASAYFNSLFVTSGADRERLLADLAEKPPAYILKPRIPADPGALADEGPAPVDVVLKDYRLERSQYNWAFYRRKAPLGPAP